MNYTISKDFYLEFGHRVWTQEGFKVNKCRHIHGHSGVFRVFLSHDSLLNGMVIDFNHLDFIKTFIDNHIDHKFLIHISDPLLLPFLNMGEFEYHYLDFDVLKNIPWSTPVMMTREKNLVEPGGDYLTGFEIDSNLFGLKDDDVRAELIQSLFILNFIPTAENLARWMKDLITFHFRATDIQVTRVEFKETLKSCAYYGD